MAVFRGPTLMGVSDQVRVVLYTRGQCHLCDLARPVVAEECAAAGIDYEEVDIDTELDTNGELYARYTDLVPVLVIDEVQVAYYHVERHRLRAALASLDSDGTGRVKDLGH